MPARAYYDCRKIRMFGLAVQCLPRRGPQKLEFVYLRMSDLKVSPRTHPPQSRKAQACGNWRSRVFLLCQDGLICKERKKAVNAKTKTYNSGYSLVVTHLTTNPPVRCLNRAERTGSLVFNVLWSYVEEKQCSVIHIPITTLWSTISLINQSM